MRDENLANLQQTVSIKKEILEISLIIVKESREETENDIKRQMFLSLHFYKCTNKHDQEKKRKKRYLNFKRNRIQ